MVTVIAIGITLAVVAPVMNSLVNWYHNYTVWVNKKLGSV